MSPPAGRLGAFATATGVGCMSGLILFLLGGASGGWAMMHDSPGVTVLGVSCLWLAPVWLACAAGANVVRRDRPLRPRDRVLLLGVLLSAGVTIAVLAWG